MSAAVSEIWTYFHIQLYLLKRYQIYYAFATDVFLGNLLIFQKQSPEVFYEKSCSLKNCNIHRKVAGLQDSNTGISLLVLRNFQDHLFWRTSANGFFWFFETPTEHRWAPATVLTLLLSSDNLLTGH